MPTHDLIGSFDEHTFPHFRTATLDTLDWGRKRHHIPMMLEVDVTAARDALRTQKAQTGEAISFTGWIIKCLAQAVGEHPHIHAVRKGRRKLILFRDVDVAIVVERTVSTGRCEQDTADALRHPQSERKKPCRHSCRNPQRTAGADCGRRDTSRRRPGGVDGPSFQHAAEESRVT